MPQSVRIVLVRPRNPLNIGAAARAMANFGFHDLRLVEPYGEAWREARSARAGLAVLEQARVETDLAAAVAGCDAVIGTTAGSARTPEIPLENWTEVAGTLGGLRVGLVFGSEKTGLGREEISHCHRLARITTRAEAPSMNLGQAVAVCCHELAREERKPVERGGGGIDAGERERIIEAWAPVLERIGVVRPQHRTGQRRRMREMLVRWGVSGEDERRLLGIARELGRVLGGTRS